jgi:hypothetical protein
MPLSKRSILLGISALFLLPPLSATADEAAAPAELAEMALREQQLQAEVDDRLSALVVAVTEREGEALSVRTTEQLRRQALRIARRAGPAPPAKPALADRPTATRVQSAGDTTCTRVGSTLECVALDRSSR